MKKIIAAFVLFIALALSGCIQQPTSQNVVEITSLGFTPQIIEINSGETVVFVNNDNALHWIASNTHPTHGDYPEGGGCLGSKFDACGGLKQGERFSFTFNQKGVWTYHDHLNSGLVGTIVVD